MVEYEEGRRKRLGFRREVVEVERMERYKEEEERWVLGICGQPEGLVVMSFGGKLESAMGVENCRRLDEE